jgi:hypothetical protein
MLPVQLSSISLVGVLTIIKQARKGVQVRIHLIAEKGNRE